MAYTPQHPLFMSILMKFCYEKVWEMILKSSQNS